MVDNPYPKIENKKKAASFTFETASSTRAEKMP